MPAPTPDPGEVVVAMRASAICRSDMSLYYGDPVVGGSEAGAGSIVPGHEPAGIVVAVGQGVTQVTEGDRVAAYLAIGEGFCRYCRTGERFLCDELQVLGFDLHGGDAEYFKIPAANVLKLHDDVGFEAAALLTDMVGTQFHAQDRLGVTGRDSVVVFGVGPMGGAAVMVANACGARVIAVDLQEDRLNLAKSLGAHHTLHVSDADDVVPAIHELTDGRGADVAIDCSGSPAAEANALAAAAKNGRVAFVGESRTTTVRPSTQFLRKTITLIGCWYFPIGRFAEIQRFALQHSLPVDQLITHRFDLGDADEAFEMFDKRETVKAVFVGSAD